MIQSYHAYFVCVRWIDREICKKKDVPGEPLQRVLDHGYVDQWCEYFWFLKRNRFERIGE